MNSMNNYKEILPVIHEELPMETKEKIKISVRENIVCNDESEEFMSLSATLFSIKFEK